MKDAYKPEQSVSILFSGLQHSNLSSVAVLIDITIIGILICVNAVIASTIVGTTIPH